MNSLQDSTRSIEKLLKPRSIAIVGASSNPQKLGSIIVRNIQEGGYRGKLYPVNASSQQILGLQVYTSYVHIPEIPDLAIIAIPAAGVLEVVREIGQKGTTACIVISAGFKESGPEGEAREAELQALAKEYSLTLLGPNCLGLVNTSVKLNATFGQGISEKGSLHFVSQSGAIASSIFDWAAHYDIGFADFVTLGNKLGVTEIDLLEYWHQQEAVPAPALKRFGTSNYAPVGMYLESLADGATFIEAAQRIARHNPVFLLKPGKTQAAQRAMRSHTGSIAGDDQVLTQALNQAGVIRCDSMEELFDLSMAFSWSQAPSGKRVAIISNAGGPAVVSSDAVEEAGLEMAQLSVQTKELLGTHLPRAASIVNPVDVLGDALSDRYEQALKAVLEEKNVDAVVIIVTPQIMTQITETASVIGRLSQRYKIPIFCSFMGGQLSAQSEKILSTYHIPFFTFPERAVHALGKMWWWKNWQTQAQKSQKALEPVVTSPAMVHTHREFFRKTLAKNTRYVSSSVISELFEDWTIAIPPSTQVANLQQAQAFVKKYGFPVVLKLTAPELLHKTEVSGVITNIRSMKQLESASQLLISRKSELPAALAKTVQLQLQVQVEDGVEVIVGIKRSAEFGMVLLFGAGGTLVELLADTQLQVLPATQKDIKRLVESSKAYSLLVGYRGGQQLALEKLYQLITQLVNLVTVLPFFEEIEINPVIVTKTEAYAVDGKVILAEF